MHQNRFILANISSLLNPNRVNNNKIIVFTEKANNNN